MLAGDIGAIRRYAPAELKHKTVVVECASRRRPGRSATAWRLHRRHADAVARRPATRWAAGRPPPSRRMLVALRTDPMLPLNEDTYLDLMADIDWTPAHPLSAARRSGHQPFRLRHSSARTSASSTSDPLLPLDDATCPMSLSRAWPPTCRRCTSRASRAANRRRPARRSKGYLFTLGATPRQMMKHGERFTYTRLNQAARMAERKGARIMGLGAFTSVVGDAGITVAHEADIAITSGNSLTVAATLEAAKQAVIKMGAHRSDEGQGDDHRRHRLDRRRVCARLLAQAIDDVVLVSIEPEKLIELKRTIQQETPGARRDHRHQSRGADWRLRPDRHGHLGVRPARDRHHEVQARRGDLRRGAAARHQPGRGRAAPRRAGDRERRSADPRRHRLWLRHRPAAQDLVRLSGRDGPAGDGRPLRRLHAGPQHRDRARQGDLPAVSSTASSWPGCARSASTSPTTTWLPSAPLPTATVPTPSTSPRCASKPSASCRTSRSWPRAFSASKGIYKKWLTVIAIVAGLLLIAANIGKKR